MNRTDRNVQVTDSRERNRGGRIVETIIRKTRGRAKWWTVMAAVVGLAAQAAGQSTESIGPGQTLPVRPAGGAWPEFTPPSAPAFSPADSTGNSGQLPSLDSFKRSAFFGGPGNGMAGGRSPMTTTSPNLPSFAGLGAAHAAPGQAVSATGALIPSGSGSGDMPLPDRSPREFGNGWKTFINQQMHNRNGSVAGPAASLAAPRSASSGPRPDWNWHGYDGYNMGQTRRSTQPVTNNKASADDLAPYMKYSHLWRPAGRGAAVSLPPAAISNGPALTPAAFDQLATASPAGDANSRWGGYGATGAPSTPNMPAAPENPAKPAEPAGSIQFHAAPVDARPPAPLPPLPALTPPLTGPKTTDATSVNFAPAPTEGNNRLPMQVRERISQLCSGRCRNLVVEGISPIRLRIAFLVKDQTEAEMLTNQIGSAPELAPYKVDFEVQIGQ